MIKRWPTERIAWRYGIPLGIIYSLFQVPEDYWGWDGERIAYIGGSIVGGAVFGALSFAAVSGARNLILRAK
jgi:hypothetical protein